MEKSKINNLKNRIIIIILALILPLSTCGMIYSLFNFSKAEAASYISSYISEVSLSNNNFSSSTSNYSLSTSLTGWTGQITDRKTTSGIINVGSTFQNYMTGTYYLSNNPLASGSDNYILMINSRTSSSEEYSPAHQGYQSSSITLEANSYYSFQVAFKSDTNYTASYTYTQSGVISEDTTITLSTFNGGGDTATVGFGEYISFSYNSKYYYLEKTLDTDNPITLEAQTDVTVFYEDDDYVGVLVELDPTSDTYSAVYVSWDDVESGKDATKVNINEGAIAYTCNLEYDEESGNFKLAENTPYYSRETTYTAMSMSSYGSIYISGLVDEDGNEIEVNFVRIQSEEWVTFYFFIATGDEEQTVTIDLWLGSENTTISGVVFYDDIHIYQYSENAFWKTYSSYYGKSYSQDLTDEDGTTETVETNCVQLVDLREEEDDSYSDYNFDFEEGVYNDDVSSLKGWTKDENSTGNALVFDVKAPEYFKSITGYDFVGSNLSAKVVLDGDEVVSLEENRYVLGLWADDEYVSVTSQDVEILANEIYKISVQYKISELTDGSVYLSVVENDNVLTKYNLTEDQYTVSELQTSSGVSENSDDDFVNDYATIEFYVKGSALYDSSINIVLSIGTSDESATGCVVFDDVKIEKATTDEYDEATNAYELGVRTTSPTITNGNFDSVTISSKDDTAPFTPESWTIESSDNGISFAGVINTYSDKYSKYYSYYQEYYENGTEDIDNPYLWAAYLSANPKNSYGVEDADNILMLANITSTYQTVTSDTISLSASTSYKISFDFETFGISGVSKFTISLYSSDGVKLYEETGVSSEQSWSNYEIYIQSFSGATDIYIQIDFGTSDSTAKGFAFFDNFKLTDGVTIPDDDDSNVVDMSDFYLNLPTNNITSDTATSTTTAYTTAIANTDGLNSNIGYAGIIKSDYFDINENSSTFQIETDDDEPVNVFYMYVQGEGAYTITSNFTIDLTADTYYALTFTLKTNFKETNLDSDTEYSYGVTVGLTGFDYATELRSNDEYTTYTIYFNPSEDASAQLYFALVCDANETRGAAVIYNLSFEEVDEEDYTAAQETVSADGYSVNEDKVYVSSQDDVEEDEDTDTDDEDEDTDSETTFDWLYVPTLIFGLAIVIAIVGFFLRKIKIKKIEKKRKETYDRKDSINIDSIKLKAQQERDKNIQEIQETVNKFKAELNSLEKTHKQRILQMREKDKGKVSKETDKEFKQYASKHTVISERIDSLNKQIDEMKTPEYLLSLERKVYAQEEMKQRELAKASKEMNKEKEKLAKKAEKKNSKETDNSTENKNSKTNSTENKESEKSEENKTNKKRKK